MGLLKKNIAVTFVFIALSFIPYKTFGQNQNEDKYRRSSIYSILISHPSKGMDKEITNAFMSLETPDKYNNHDLSLKVVTTDNKKEEVISKEVREFLTNNNVSKRLVSKWFNRDRLTKGFDGELIIKRGQYNASEIDVLNAKNSKRGLSLLADAGYELIGNTFVICNDIQYIDKEENAQIAKGVFSVLGSIAGVLTGGDNIVSTVSDLAETISDMISGFTVKITTYLYQLEWNDDIANNFYDNYYFDKSTDDASINEKIASYDSNNNLFNLKYLGSYNAKSSKTVMRGLYKPEDVFRKVCARAIDNNILELQRKYDQFKVKVPLYNVEPIMVKIGLKEGVRPNSKYEVLLPINDPNTGLTTYKKVGTIKPKADAIWDNRYMASEERADGADLTATTFVKVSGGEFYQGMLVREIK